MVARSPLRRSALVVTLVATMAAAEARDGLDWNLSDGASQLAYGTEESHKVASLTCGENGLIEFRADLPSSKGEKLVDGDKTRISVSWKGGEQTVVGAMREGDGFFFEATVPATAALLQALKDGRALTLSRSGQKLTLPRISASVLVQKFMDTCSGAGPAEALKTHPSWVPLARVEQRLRELNDSYGDISSAVNCRRPADRVERMICASDYLSRAELLNTRASAYAEENATKSEVDHRRYLGKLPRRCTTEQCIYDYFVKETNTSLGGTSPYEASGGRS